MPKQMVEKWKLSQSHDWLDPVALISQVVCRSLQIPDRICDGGKALIGGSLNRNKKYSTQP